MCICIYSRPPSYLHCNSHFKPQTLVEFYYPFLPSFLPQLFARNLNGSSSNLRRGRAGVNDAIEQTDRVSCTFFPNKMTDRLGPLATVVLTAPNASYDIHGSCRQRKKLTALQRRGVDQQPESNTRSTSSRRLNPRRPQDHECHKNS
jgi:hypothetical protein